jgi:hypothetical protein
VLNSCIRPLHKQKYHPEIRRDAAVRTHRHAWTGNPTKTIQAALPKLQKPRKRMPCTS